MKIILCLLIATLVVVQSRSIENENEPADIDADDLETAESFFPKKKVKKVHVIPVHVAPVHVAPVHHVPVAVHHPPPVHHVPVHHPPPVHHAPVHHVQPQVIIIKKVHGGWQSAPPVQSYGPPPVQSYGPPPVQSYGPPPQVYKVKIEHGHAYDQGYGGGYDSYRSAGGYGGGYDSYSSGGGYQSSGWY